LWPPAERRVNGLLASDGALLVGIDEVEGGRGLTADWRATALTRTSSLHRGRMTRWPKTAPQLRSAAICCAGNGSRQLFSNTSVPVRSSPAGGPIVPSITEAASQTGVIGSLL
jgi:hypothetical protein